MRNIALLLLGALVLPMAVGCSHSVIRGQSPDVVYTPNGSMGDQSMGQGGYCPPGGGYGQCPPGYCPQGCPPGGGCPGGLLGGGLGAGGTNYWAPQDLAYPDQNAMPGIVQYPYYTLKGPDCFFRK